MTNEQHEKEWQDLVEKEAEEHGKIYFSRNDLPGPGSTHDQIFEAGMQSARDNISKIPELRALIEAAWLLREYSRHHTDCSYIVSSKSCDCGYNKDVEKIRQALSLI